MKGNECITRPLGSSASKKVVKTEMKECGGVRET